MDLFGNWLDSVLDIYYMFTPFNISNADFHGKKIIKKCKINSKEFHLTIA